MAQTNTEFMTRGDLRVQCETLQRLYYQTVQQVERCFQGRAQLLRERDEARLWARRLYSILHDWGDVCMCGQVLTPDNADICPKCGELG